VIDRFALAQQRERELINRAPEIIALSCGQAPPSSGYPHRDRFTGPARALYPLALMRDNSAIPDELSRRAAAGDQNALAEAFEHYRDRLPDYARLVIGLPSGRALC
jgi:hypothetical protein